MRATIAVVLLCGVLLSSCNKPQDALHGGRRSQGRFTGIGVFDAGRLWGKMLVPVAKADDTTAGIEDDEHIIVVLDSNTGEIRQCGDHSGHCVAMNPWAGAESSVALPAKLAKHASDLAAEDRAAVRSAK